MTDPEQRKADRTPADGVPGDHRPVERGVKWGVIFAWILAIIVVLYIISVIVGNLDGQDVTEQRGPHFAPQSALVHLHAPASSAVPLHPEI